MARTSNSDDGFTVVELMVTVAIMAVLLVMAFPLFVSARITAAKRACFANQRILEGEASAWLAGDSGRSSADLMGVVDSSHPLGLVPGGHRVPTCPSADDAADPLNPTVAEGAYSFDASGTLESCTFGDVGPHDHY